MFKKPLRIFSTIGVFLLLGILLSPSFQDYRIVLGPSQTLTHDNLTRRYLLGPVPKNPARILLALPGYNDRPRFMAYYTGLHNSLPADTLVVYAQARTDEEKGRGWNAKICCGAGYFNEVDDVGYLSRLIETLRREHAAPDTPVYVAGFSNGAMMAQHLAGERPDLLAGVIAHAGPLGADGTEITLEKPVPVRLSHGRADRRLPFAGTVDTPERFDGWLAFETSVARWQTNNGQEVPVVAEAYLDLAHEWPDWRILRVWHRRPTGSRHVADFIAQVESKL